MAVEKNSSVSDLVRKLIWNWYQFQTIVCSQVHGKVQKMAEINFLCVHKKLRAKRVTPVLIREITRRVNRLGIFQAVYTAGVFLPTPFATGRYVLLFTPGHLSDRSYFIFIFYLQSFHPTFWNGKEPPNQIFWVLIPEVVTRTLRIPYFERSFEVNWLGLKLIFLTSYFLKGNVYNCS